MSDDLAAAPGCHDAGCECPASPACRYVDPDADDGPIVSPATMRWHLARIRAELDRQEVTRRRSGLREPRYPWTS